MPSFASYVYDRQAPFSVPVAITVVSLEKKDSIEETLICQICQVHSLLTIIRLAYLLQQ